MITRKQTLLAHNEYPPNLAKRLARNSEYLANIILRTTGAGLAVQFTLSFYMLTYSWESNAGPCTRELNLSSHSTEIAPDTSVVADDVT